MINDVHLLTSYSILVQYEHTHITLAYQDQQHETFRNITDKILPRQHDMNWSSEISMLVSDGYDIDSDEIQNAANNYWAGVPHHDESLWEYLTPAAKVIHVEEY